MFDEKPCIGRRGVMEHLATARQWARCPACGHKLFKFRGQGREIEAKCPGCKRLVFMSAVASDLTVIRAEPEAVDVVR